MFTRFRAPVVGLVVTLSVAAAGCGTVETVTRGSDSTAAEATPSTAAPSTAAAGAVPGPISTDLTKKPAIPTPSGTPPAQLVSKDIVVGTGAAVTDGQTATVQYVGASWSTGKEFDASWDRGQTFPFVLGAGNVIPGWDQGVKGMKVGGRRELVIPPALGYGAQGSPPTIAANETLVFVIDLKKVS